MYNNTTFFLKIIVLFYLRSYTNLFFFFFSEEDALCVAEEEIRMNQNQIAVFVSSYKTCGDVIVQSNGNDIVHTSGVSPLIDSGEYGDFSPLAAHIIVREATIYDSPMNINYWIVHVGIYARLRCLNTSWKSLVDECITPMHIATENLFRLR